MATKIAIKNFNREYWTDEVRRAALEAKTFEELAQTALVVLKQLPKPVGQVCGPISTGGVGSIEGNLRRFQETIERLVRQGRVLFDQMPFEEHIFRVVENTWGARQNKLLLEQFYRPVFESRHVSTLYFIPGWESSEGAAWEHELGRQLQMEIVYLDDSLYR